MMFRILAFLLLPVICLAQVNSTVEKPTGELLSNEISPNDMKRNASFNLDEIKVRWKKAALENCTGVPCVVTPPPPPPPSFTCGTSTVTDFDGNIYETVAIVGTGVTQCWTTTNLKVTRYNDGTLITDFTNSSNASWVATPSGARTEYVNGGVPLSGYVGTYGYLYNWNAATDSRKLCPDGWHVPTDAEWTIMIQALVPSELLNNSTTAGNQSVTAGPLMKENSSLWSSPRTNTSGFSARPSGNRSNTGASSGFSTSTYFWSATVDPTNSSQALSRLLFDSNSNVGRFSIPISIGSSVRCLKD